MTTISAIDDPLTYLQPPTSGGSGSSIWQLRLKCGLLIGGADSVVSLFTGWSPLDRWVFQPFSGDWDAFDKAGSAWQNAGKSISAVATNVNALPGQVGDSWNGQAMDAWAELQTKITDAIGSLPEACDAMGEFAEALADMARAIVELIAEILGIIGDAITRILLKAWFPIVGQIAAASEIVIVAGRVVRFHGRITVQLKNFYTQAQKIEKVIKTIQKTMAVLEKIHAALEARGSAVSSSNRVNTATRALA